MRLVIFLAAFIFVGGCTATLTEYPKFPVLSSSENNPRIELGRYTTYCKDALAKSSYIDRIHKKIHETSVSEGFVSESCSIQVYVNKDRSVDVKNIEKCSDIERAKLFVSSLGDLPYLSCEKGKPVGFTMLFGSADDLEEGVWRVPVRFK